MHVLLTAADGFIGSALVAALDARGHALTLCVRNTEATAHRWPRHRVVGVDFMQAQRAEDWLQLLAGVDAVVNAVGIFRERPGQTFAALHARAPIALFQACVARGVRRIVQVSALGAADDAVSDFLRSKQVADSALGRLPLASTVVRPSLVFATGGASAQLFLRLAALPLIPLPGQGDQCVQPIHRDDLVATIVALLEMDHPPRLLEAVGRAPLSLREFLAALRGGLGLPRARFLPIPWWLMRTGAAAAGWLPGGLLDKHALEMLEQGSCGDVTAIARVLGRHPRATTDFISAEQAPLLRDRARLGWLLPLLRLSVALVWIVTGIVSMGWYPVADSLTLLARVGITGTAAMVALHGAAWLDVLLGLGTLFLRRRRWLYALQAAVIVGYTAIITVWLPEFWLHPYGPVLKNLPLLAALWLLHELDGAGSEKERRS